jgi:hypothetical protein
MKEYADCLSVRDDALRSGVRSSVQAALDQIDTTDPAWPSVAAVLQEFVAAGIDLDATVAAMAVKLGKLRWAADDSSERTDPATLLTTCSIVYYIRRSNLIKIGTTASPHARFNELMPDEILAAEPGTYLEEKLRHRQFRHLRQQGEYFRDAPELRDHIRGVLELHGSPDSSWPSLARKTPKPWRLPMPVSTETMTATEARTDLGINESTLRAWVHRGILTSTGRSGQKGRQYTYFREHLLLLRDSTTERQLHQGNYDV